MSIYEASITNPKKQLEFYKELSEQLGKENKQLKERIEYLERSNNRREDTILEQRKEISNLEDKVDEAIEYIEEHIKYECDDAYNGMQFYSYHLYDFNKQDLLDILKEVSE